MVWPDRQNILCKQRACLGNTVCGDELRFNEMSEGINNSVPFSGVMGAGFSAGHKTKWSCGPWKGAMQKHQMFGRLAWKCNANRD